MKTYLVEVMIGDKRRVTVQANSASEAQAKVHAGKYQKLGHSLDRGFLTVGAAEEQR